jgi:hypothetical protein
VKIYEMREIIESITYKHGWEIELDHDDRPYIQLRVIGTDSVTHQRTVWKSGKRYLSPHMCRQEIVGAVFGLIKDAEEHEMREWFRYKGASIFNPHLDPDALAEVAKKKASFNVRDNAMTMVE